jgi:NADPH-dependent glutamate synthase beta subunit-like oxidoreductase/NAD(P)H-flavin reductase
MQLENPINSIFKLEFSDLYNRAGLQKIDQYFLQFLSDADADLYQKYLDALVDPKATNSELLIAVGKILEEFLVLFFNIQNANSELQNQHSKLANLYIAKRLFIQRRVAKKYSPSSISEFVIPAQAGIQDELEFANKIAFYLTDETKYSSELEELEKYCAWALYNDSYKNSVLFKLPKKIDFENLVELETVDGIKKSPEHHLKNRDGFKLTDPGCNLAEALNEANYCIFCHNQGKDSCRSGLKEKDGTFKKDQFKTELSGCPLDEKISEMNLLKSEGKSIAALAMAIVDNPMIAGTGHRICNDCMKSCIYQKQEPVNIPQVETRTLKDVLNLPFGFEIYSLLTRWNPLNLQRVLEKAPSGYKVLVAGLGPAGYTLAHHLLNEGHLVVGVDGLKIEPLDPKISGIDLDGNRCEFKPIKDIKEIYEELDERQIGGFGGVAEYGITVRWDKNFLKIIRLLLERRAHFRMFGGFRLGSGLDCYDALKEADFDHVALCLGAGWAKIPEIKNNFLKGIRMASDFLMALQLTGAERSELPSNLQVRLPVIVVGAGLTAMDTACEALAYYPKQVENFANHYQILCKKLGKDATEKSWSIEDKLIAEEFLEHHKLISDARKKGENVTKLLQKLGGAKIIYRKNLQDSPAYRLNHEEVAKAFEEGIEFIENATPFEAVDDGFGQIKSLKILVNNEEKEIPAKALFLAAGTTPNKAPFYEDKLKFDLDNGTFQIIDLLGEKLPAINSPKGDGIGFICAKNDEGKTVSFFGDLHPSFNGSVVKAMASAKNGYPTINSALQNLPQPEISYSEFLTKINQDFAVKVKEVNILSDYFIELVVSAPLLAQKTGLGHIFRLHNYHSLAKTWIATPSARNDDVKNLIPYSSHRHCEEGQRPDAAIQKTVFAMEGVAVTAYKVDKEAGTITVMVVNAGGSSSFVKHLKPGEPIIFMGPSGIHSNHFNHKHIVLIAGGRGIFPLAGLAAEYKKHHNKVILFCGFKSEKDVVRKEELQNSCDELILDFSGDVVAAVTNYFRDKKDKIDVILTMGSDEMMHKVAGIYHNQLKENLSDCAVGITSLSNPMQCMLKGVCSQCLQRKIDEKTGKEKFFYACLAQDQKLGDIDFNFLKNRCGQNSLTEKLTKIWLNNLN